MRHLDSNLGSSKEPMMSYEFEKIIDEPSIENMETIKIHESIESPKEKGLCQSTSDINNSAVMKIKERKRASVDEFTVQHKSVSRSSSPNGTID